MITTLSFDTDNCLLAAGGLRLKAFFLRTTGGTQRRICFCWVLRGSDAGDLHKTLANGWEDFGKKSGPGVEQRVSDLE